MWLSTTIAAPSARKPWLVLGFRAVVLAAVTLDGTLRAEPLPVPNGSYESPKTSYVSINVDNWQKNPKPAWYQEEGGFLWTQLTGLFKNTAATSFDHLDNCDGDQAIWLFAVPEVALFQDYESKDWNDTVPTHAFNVTLDPGKFYCLTVGINGGGGGMLEGATMQVSLYYLDGANKVTLGVTTITNSLETFPNHTHFVDFQVRLPVVKSTDAWAGKRLGIQFLSTVDADNEGGYWDLDHVRLDTGPDPLAVKQTGPNAEVSWPSLAGYKYQFQTSDNMEAWSDYGSPQDGSGSALSQLFPVVGTAPKYFRTKVTDTP